MEEIGRGGGGGVDEIGEGSGWIGWIEDVKRQQDDGDQLEQRAGRN